MIVKFVNPLTIPAGKFMYCELALLNVNCPPLNVPPLGNVPAHVAPPIESAVFVPPLS